MKSILKSLTFAAAGLVAGAGIAGAAVVENDLNLRSGPGTKYRVVDVMPAGAFARVLDCGGSWCRVAFRGRVGWASASYLGGGGAYAAAPIYRAPPAVSFGFGFGRPHHRWGHHRGWRHHRRWR